MLGLVLGVRLIRTDGDRTSCPTPDAFPVGITDAEVVASEEEPGRASVTVGAVRYDAGAVFVSLCGHGAPPAGDPQLVHDEGRSPVVGGAIGLDDGERWSQVLVFGYPGPGRARLAFGDRDVAVLAFGSPPATACPSMANGTPLIQCGAIWSVELAPAVQLAARRPDLVEGEVTDSSGANLGFYLLDATPRPGDVRVLIGFNPPPADATWIEVRIDGLVADGARVTAPNAGWPAVRIPLVP